jgi:hypothetical protein
MFLFQKMTILLKIACLATMVETTLIFLLVVLVRLLVLKVLPLLLIRLFGLNGLL